MLILKIKFYVSIKPKTCKYPLTNLENEWNLKINGSIEDINKMSAFTAAWRLTQDPVTVEGRYDWKQRAKYMGRIPYTAANYRSYSEHFTPNHCTLNKKNESGNERI